MQNLHAARQTSRHSKIGVGVLAGLALLFSLYMVADHFYAGEVTVYHDSCGERSALRTRLAAAGIPYRIDEKNGTVLGAVEIDDVLKKIGLTSLSNIPVDSKEKCTR